MLDKEREIDIINTKGVLDMKKLNLTLFLFLTFSTIIFAQEWAISFNGQVTIYSTQGEFRIANVAIATELRNLCRQGIPIYWAISMGGINTGKEPISPNIQLQTWEVARRSLATDEQLRLAIREGYWIGIVPEFIPPGTGNLRDLQAGEYKLY